MSLQRNLLFLALACSLAACSKPAPEAPATPQAPAATAAPTAGIDLAGIDKNVKPGDDFDAYANGGWRNTADIPEDRSSIGTGYEVQKKAEQRNAELIKGLGASNPAAGSEARKIADYYAAFMDEAGIEARGLEPLKPELAKIDAIASKADLARVLGTGLRADVDPLFGV